MTGLLHRSKLRILTVALACSGLAVSAAAAQAAQAATQPPAAICAQHYLPPDPC